MRKYLATALFAVLPLGFFLANGSSEASARDRGFLSNLFSKRKATECEVPCATSAKVQEPKKETPKPEVKPEPKKETPKHHDSHVVLSDEFCDPNTRDSAN